MPTGWQGSTRLPQGLSTTKPPTSGRGLVSFGQRRLGNAEQVSISLSETTGCGSPPSNT
jgi:hypothetical protein